MRSGSEVDQHLGRDKVLSGWQETKSRYPLGEDRRSKIKRFVGSLDFHNFDHWKYRRRILHCRTKESLCTLCWLCISSFSSSSWCACHGRPNFYWKEGV